MFAVELQHITKSFGGFRANNDVHLSVNAGTIHALVGENGAGKSTLMKILYGMTRPDTGTIRIHEREASFSSPTDAIRLGVGMVHQHFMLIPEFTVAENIILGQEPMSSLGRVDMKAAHEKIMGIVEQYRFDIDPGALVRDLSVGIQQRVEILKILYRNAQILILDEPTAVLTPQETLELFATMKMLREQGKTIILITHKLNEIMDSSDGVTVLRRGSVVFESATASTTREELTHYMIGRELHPVPSKGPPLFSGMVLEVEHLSATDDHGQPVLKDISFVLESGEILGIAGVEGNGQTYLINVLTGTLAPSQGQLRLKGHAFSPRTHTSLIAHIPEDRHKQGLVLDFSIEENMILGRQREILFNSALSLDYGRISAFSDEIARQYDVRAGSLKQPARGLSGGNQQKIVVGRELSKQVSLIIASHPTRGLDIGAAEFVHQAMLEARKQGRAVLLLSSDLSELMSLSDRIAVMFKGEIVAILEPRECTEFDLGLYMSGALRRAL